MKNILVVGGVLVVVFLVWFIWESGHDHDASTPPSGEVVEEAASSGEVTSKLTATTWAWQETQMNDGEIITPNQASAFTLTFNPDGTMNGTTDCNGFFGSYTLEDTKVEFGPLGMTMMYCEGSQERDFTGMLENTDFVFFDDQDNLVLLLRYDSGSVIFAPAQSS